MRRPRSKTVAAPASRTRGSVGRSSGSSAPYGLLVVHRPELLHRCQCAPQPARAFGRHQHISRARPERPPVLRLDLHIAFDQQAASWYSRSNLPVSGCRRQTPAENLASALRQAYHSCPGGSSSPGAFSSAIHLTGDRSRRSPASPSRRSCRPSRRHESLRGGRARPSSVSTSAAQRVRPNTRVGLPFPEATRERPVTGREASISRPGEGNRPGGRTSETQLDRSSLLSTVISGIRSLLPTGDAASIQRRTSDGRSATSGTGGTLATMATKRTPLGAAAPNWA